jgi:TPR repeat protein
MNHLGSLYRDGHGVPSDYTEARRWYERAPLLGSRWPRIAWACCMSTAVVFLKTIPRPGAGTNGRPPSASKTQWPTLGTSIVKAWAFPRTTQKRDAGTKRPPLSSSLSRPTT